jgi:hypothetical protein
LKLAGAATLVTIQAAEFVADENGSWLIADGNPLERSEYTDLFRVLGTTYGGSETTFNLPDLRRRYEAQPIAGHSHFSGPWRAVAVNPFNQIIKVRPGNEDALPIGTILAFAGNTLPI